MEKTIQIKGLKESEYPVLYKAIENVMLAYGMTRIRVVIFPWGINAFAVSLFGDFLIITKKVFGIMNKEEIEAILAHEFSHLFNRDTIVGYTVYLFFSIPLILAVLISYNIGKTKPTSISLAQALLFLIFFVVSVFIFTYGRKVQNRISTLLEIRADREAVLRTKNPEAMRTALFKLYSELYTPIKRPSFFKRILDSFEYIEVYFLGLTHPSLKERIEHLEIAEKILDTQKETSH